METIDQYVRTRQIELAHEIQKRKKIYLDTNFWIECRKVMLGESINSGYEKLLELLKNGVLEGKLVCPISQSTLVEMMKQDYISSRIYTAKLIDELSLGVSLIDTESRIATEISYFIYLSCGQNDLYKLQELVWTKLRLSSCSYLSANSLGC